MAVLPTGGGHDASRPLSHFFRCRHAPPAVLDLKRADDGKTACKRGAAVAGAQQRELSTDLEGRR
jgi:hypothetical protein